jgi:NAD(P)H dehydrogenase (quinone)
MELACQSVLTVLMNFGFLVFGVTDYVSRDMTLH